MTESKLKQMLEILTPIKGDKLVAEAIRTNGKAAGISESNIETTIHSFLVAKYVSYLGALYYGGKALFG